jgi:hypothetical protein
MKRLKGPDLKMPDLKMPQFLVDLYWDLRDRHLLPLVALGLVAIVAVPFLLGGKSEGPSPRPGGAKAVSSVAGEAGATRFTVVEAKPGLRDYRKRLEHRTPTDPFVQHYTSAEVASGKGEVEVTSGGGTAEEGGESPGGGGDAEPGFNGQGRFTRYATAIDVKVTTTKTLPSGKKETTGPVLHERVLPVAPLPSDKVQAVAYMGPSANASHLRNVILLVSDAVTAIFGEGRCLSGTETCQLLEVEPGMPETFVFGPESTRYKIVVLNPRPVPVGSYEQ